MDIGTPERYLQGTVDILEGAVHTELAARLADAGRRPADTGVMEGELRTPSLIGAGSVVHRGAVVGSHAVLGERVTVGAGARIERSALLDGVHVGEGTTIVNAIISPGAVIGDNCTIEGDVVIGAGVEIEPGDIVPGGARIFPGVDQAKRGA
jgi:mannose-1-phosphate guanylyltransferase